MVLLQKFSFLTFLNCLILLAYSPACRTQYPHRLQCQSHFDHCLSPNSPGHRKWAKLHSNPLFGEQSRDSKDVKLKGGEAKKEEKQMQGCAPQADHSGIRKPQEPLGLGTGHWRGDGSANHVCTKPLVKFVYLLLFIEVCPAGRSLLHPPRLCCAGAPGSCPGSCMPCPIMWSFLWAWKWWEEWELLILVGCMPRHTRRHWEQWLRVGLGSGVCVGCWSSLSALGEGSISSWGFPSGPDVCSPESGRLICWIRYNHFFCHSFVSLSLASMLSVTLHSCPEC